MSMIDNIPDEYLDKEKLDEFIMYLKILPVPLFTKKYLLLTWCEYLAVPMDREYAERVGIPLQI